MIPVAAISDVLMVEKKRTRIYKTECISDLLSGSTESFPLEIIMINIYSNNNFGLEKPIFDTEKGLLRKSAVYLAQIKRQDPEANYLDTVAIMIHIIVRKIKLTTNWVGSLFLAVAHKKRLTLLYPRRILFLLLTILFSIGIGGIHASQTEEKKRGYHASGESSLTTDSTLIGEGAVSIAQGAQPATSNTKSKGTLDGPLSLDGIRLMEAVLATLANQPSIFLQEEETKINKGTVQKETGRFDTSFDVAMSHDHAEIPLSSEAQEGGLSSSSTIDETTFSLGFRKLFRTGVSISPSVSSIRNDTTLSDSDPVASGRVDFLITVPLLKGLGGEATGAGELKAKNDYEASVLLLSHSVSQAVLNTTGAYWVYVAFKRRLQELIGSESRAIEMLKNMKELVKAAEKPAADLERVEANLASKTATRFQGEQDLFEARQNLGLTVGFSYDEFSQLPPPTDKFPELVTKDLNKLNATQDLFIKKSINRRADYKAFEKNQYSDQILIRSSKNNLKPQLDFNLNLGYSGMDEGNRFGRMATSLTSNVPGASVSATLLFTFPLKNNSARGQLLERKSQYRQGIIQTKDLARNIQSNVAVAFSAVKYNLSALEKSREAIDFYKLSVKNEKAKYLLGMSTLIDIINTEDGLTLASLDEISAHLNLARAIANLRFETGTLISPSIDGQYSITMLDLTTIPLNLITHTEKGQ